MLPTFLTKDQCTSGSYLKPNDMCLMETSKERKEDLVVLQMFPSEDHSGAPVHGSHSVSPLTVLDRASKTSSIVSNVCDSLAWSSSISCGTPLLDVIATPRVKPTLSTQAAKEHGCRNVLTLWGTHQPGKTSGRRLRAASFMGLISFGTFKAVWKAGITVLIALGVVPIQKAPRTANTIILQHFLDVLEPVKNNNVNQGGLRWGCDGETGGLRCQRNG